MTDAREETESPALRVEQAGPVATIVIDHPQRRNAMTAHMWQQFEPLLDRLGADDTVKVVVVRGAGDNFCAGADISGLLDILHDPATGQHDGGDVTAGENALAGFHKPTVAAIDGYCVGGGWQIAGACDIRIASERAIFGITPSKVGIVYPLSGIERLVRLAGPATAKYLLFSGDFVGADEAQGLGLLTRVVPADTFCAEVTDFADRLATRSQLSIQAMKDLVDTIAGTISDPIADPIAGPVADGASVLAERNAHWQREMAASGEPAIGIEAFLSKQTPRFRWTGHA